MKCNQSRSGFELESPCPFPTTITTTPRLFCDVLSIFALSLFILRALFFFAAIIRYSDSLLRFQFFYVQVFLCEISIVCCLKYPYCYFSSHFCFLVIVVLLIFVLFVLFLVALVFHYSFLCSLRVIVSMYRRYFSCWRVNFLILFLTHWICQYHFCDVRPYASTWVFLFSCPFL